MSRTRPARRSAASSVAIAAWMRRRSAGPMSSYSVVRTIECVNSKPPSAALARSPAFGPQPGEPLGQSEVAQREPAEDGHHLRQLDVGGGAQEQPPQDRRRRTQVHGRCTGDEPGATAVDDDGAPVDERLRHLADEEGVAPAGVDHGVGHLIVERYADDGGRQRPGLLPVEGLEVDDGPPAVEGHPLAEPVELGGAVAESQSGDGEDREVGEADEQCRQRQRLAVGDVEVLEHQHDRSVVAHGADQPDGGGEHPRKVPGIGSVVAGSLDLGPEGVAATGDVPPEHQPGEHVAEHCERDAVVEIVCPTDHPRVGELLGPGDQLGDEPRLADAGLAADHQRRRRSALDALELLQGDLDVELASDERWRPSHNPPLAPKCRTALRNGNDRRGSPTARRRRFAGPMCREAPTTPIDRRGARCRHRDHEGYTPWTCRAIATTASTVSPTSSSATSRRGASWGRRSPSRSAARRWSTSGAATPIRSTIARGTRTPSASPCRRPRASRPWRRTSWPATVGSTSTSRSPRTGPSSPPPARSGCSSATCSPTRPASPPCATPSRPAGSTTGTTWSSAWPPSRRSGSPGPGTAITRSPSGSSSARWCAG